MKYTKGFTFITALLIVLGITIIGGISYYAGRNRSTTDSTKSHLPQGESTQTQSNEQKTDIFVVNQESDINVSDPSFAVNGKIFSGINAFILYMQTLPHGTYDVSVSASGYKTMTDIKIVVPNNLKGMTINLTPVIKDHECPKRPSSNNAFALCGYMTDENHNALGGVQVASLNFNDVSVTTAPDGYYEVEFLPLKNYDCGDPITFTYEKQDYKTLNHIINGPYIWVGGDMGTRLTMKRGVGDEEQITKHGMCN